MLHAIAAASFAALVGSAAALPREVVSAHLASALEEPERAFQQWVEQHDKEYKDDAQEHARRFAIWQDNLDYAIRYNEDHDTHWLGLNIHADLTHDEFSARHRFGFDYETAKRLRSEGALKASSFQYADISEEDLPKAVDWRRKGAVTPVKNQAQCGSCWAFSTTGAIEGANAIYTGALESLSEQELVDCDQAHDHGCNGGLMDTAFEFVIENGGLDTEKDYKYHAIQGICNVKRRNRHVVTIDSYEDVPSEDEVALKKAVAHQPVAVAIQANERPFQLYTGGVFTEECGEQLDHGVLVVGYGTDNGTDYWLVKNSWGQMWGEHGFIRLERGLESSQAGMCGIAKMPSYPVKKHDNPPRPPRPSPDPPTPPPSPGPGPGPVQCDAVMQCPSGTTCCCVQDLLSVCLQWACCPIPGATCCEDKVHCCPHQLPVCDVAHGRCLPKVGADALLQGVPWLEKQPAQRSFSRSSAVLHEAV